MTPPAPDGLPRVSYAQHQEDILLDRLFSGRVGTYVDVGAHHPIRDSNTCFFYERGWTGVNIEPQPHLFRLLAGHRPRDLNLAVAVSDAEGSLPFYEVPDCDGLSTLSAEVAAGHRRRGLRVVPGTIPVRTLAALVAEFRVAAPELLFVDVEGHEPAVLRGVPWEGWRPQMVVVESTRPLSTAASHQAWEPLLLGHGYRFAAFNGVNRFYLRDDLDDQLELLQVPVNVLDHYRTREVVALEEEVRRLTHRLRQLEVGLARAGLSASGESDHSAGI